MAQIGWYRAAAWQGLPYSFGDKVRKNHRPPTTEDPDDLVWISNGDEKMLSAVHYWEEYSYFDHCMFGGSRYWCSWRELIDTVSSFMKFRWTNAVKHGPFQVKIPKGVDSFIANCPLRISVPPWHLNHFVYLCYLYFIFFFQNWLQKILWSIWYIPMLMFTLNLREVDNVLFEAVVWDCDSRSNNKKWSP